MSTETEATKKEAIHKAMASALTKAAKTHPKKVIGGGLLLAGIGVALQFAEPLCALLPNPIAATVCKVGTQVAGKVVEEQLAPVEADGEPKVDLSDDEPEGGATLPETP